MTYSVLKVPLNPNQPTEQRAPPVFGRATITLDIGRHSSSYFCHHATFGENGSRNATVRVHTDRHAVNDKLNL